MADDDFKNARTERQKNFDLLREGLIGKYDNKEQDLVGMQVDSILKLAVTDKEDHSLSSGYFHACTGFGKTFLMKALADAYYSQNKNKKIVIFEENTAVLEQVKKDLAEKASFSESDIGAFYGDEKTVDKPIIICTYASMKNMIDIVGKENIGLALCDEAHHILSGNRQRVAKELNNACLYGFTATPVYDEDKNCTQVFGRVIDSVTIADGIRNQLLCGVKNGLLIASTPLDLSAIKSTTGDYDDEKLMALIAKSSPKSGIKGALVDYYFDGYDDNLGFIKGKTTIINVPSQKEADELAKMMNEREGKIIAKAYHSRSNDEVLTEFNDGKFPVLIQVNRLTEGYNNPKVEVCINYPTASFVRETQRGGRVLRYDKDNPLKLALVLDIAFMQNSEGDVYTEIAKNGQVLFKDIAGDYYITSAEYEKARVNKKTGAIGKEGNESEDQRPTSNVSQADDKTKKDKNEISFTAATSLDDLFLYNWDYEKYRKQTFIPPKDKNDITYKDFLRLSIREIKDGKEYIVSKDRKITLYHELVNNKDLRNKGIVALRNAGKNAYYLIIGDMIDEFNEKSGYRICDESDRIPDKKENDIGNNAFINDYQVDDSDHTLMLSEKKDLFNILVAGKKPQDSDKKLQTLYNKLECLRIKLKTMGIVGERQLSNGQIYYFIIGDKIKEFNQVSGYVISDKDSTPVKTKNDLTCDDIIKEYLLIDPAGNFVRGIRKLQFIDAMINGKNLQDLSKELQDLFIKLKNNGIVAKRKTSYGRHCHYFIGDKIKEFNQVSGYRIVTPQEMLLELQQKADQAKTEEEKKKLQAQIKFIFTLKCKVISDKDSTPLKKNNDLTNDDINKKYLLIDPAGNFVRGVQKSQFIDALINGKNLQYFSKELQDLFIKLKDNGIVALRKANYEPGRRYFYFIGDKIDEFNKLSGYRIVTPQEMLLELQQKADQAKTEEEKKKLQAQIKFIFTLKCKRPDGEEPSKSPLGPNNDGR